MARRISRTQWEALQHTHTDISRGVHSIGGAERRIDGALHCTGRTARARARRGEAGIWGYASGELHRMDPATLPPRMAGTRWHAVITPAGREAAAQPAPEPGKRSAPKAAPTTPAEIAAALSPAQAAALRGARSTTDIPDTALESHWLYITTGRELPYGTVRSLQARDLVSSPRTVWVELPDEYVGLETFPLTDTGREVLAALQGEDAAEDPADAAEPEGETPAPEADQADAEPGHEAADVAFIRVYHCADGRSEEHTSA